MLNLILSSLETGRTARASDKHGGWEKGIKKERSVSAGPRQKRELSHHRSYLKFKHNTPPTPLHPYRSPTTVAPVAACMAAFSSGDRVSPTHLYSAFCVFLGIWWGLIRMLPWLEQRRKEKNKQSWLMKHYAEVLCMKKKIYIYIYIYTICFSATVGTIRTLSFYFIWDGQDSLIDFTLTFL